MIDLNHGSGFVYGAETPGAALAARARCASWKPR